QLLLYRCHRNDALVRVTQVLPDLLGLHRPSFEQKNACDNLKAVGNAVLHLLEQDFLLLKQFILFAINLAAPRHVLNRQKNGRGPTISSKAPTGIEEHYAPPDGREFVLDLVRLYGAVLRDDVFEDRAESRNIPLLVA